MPEEVAWGSPEAAHGPTGDLPVILIFSIRLAHSAGCRGSMAAQTGWEAGKLMRPDTALCRAPSASVTSDPRRTPLLTGSRLPASRFGRQPPTDCRRLPHRKSLLQPSALRSGAAFRPWISATLIRSAYHASTPPHALPLRRSGRFCPSCRQILSSSAPTAVRPISADCPACLSLLRSLL